MLSPLEDFASTAPFSWYAVPRSPAVFHLGMRRNPEDFRGISIVDQLQLAEFFVEEAASRKIIGPRFPVLIYGAGAAGVSAAMTAARLGVPATVREKSDAPFGPQARSGTRWLHPHQYSWPKPEWRNPEFEGLHARALAWKAGFAPEVAKQLSTQFDHAQRRYDITFAPNTAAASLPVRKAGWEKLPEPERRQLYLKRYQSFVAQEDPEQLFALYLICTGFGKERCSLPPHNGFPFWSTDPIPANDFGCGKKEPRILLSGGGDGAQQDLLRFAFGVPPLDVISNILVATEVTRRGRKWRQHMTAEVRRLQEIYDLHAVDANFDALVTSIPSEVWFWIKRAIQKMLRPEFVISSTIRFVFPRAYVPRCYPLNRILVLFLRRHILEETGADIFLSETSLDAQSIPIPPHSCAKSASECWGFPHRVQLDRLGSSESWDFDILVVRHGLFPL